MTTPAPQNLRGVTERIEALLGAFDDAAGGTRTKERAEDLIGLLMQFYGAGISRLLKIADDQGALSDDLLERLGDDELVSSLLILHDLHPLDTQTRVQRALDGVRPYLGSHGGDVEILAVEGDIVRLRMQGSCESCPSSAVTLNYAIEKAILEAAPEISRIEAEEAPPAAAQNLIQLQRRPLDNGASRSTNVPSEWLTVEDLPPLSSAAPLAAVELAGMRVLVCVSDERLYAYRDTCPNCRSPLDQGRLDGAILSCRACGHRFDVRLAGRATDDSTLHLDPLPLLAEAGAVRIAVPAAVH